MLFSSYSFIFVFLPAVLLAFHLLARQTAKNGGKQQHRYAQMVLIGASLVFYGFWDVRYVPLILGSIAANYLIASQILTAPQTARSKAWMIAGVIFNLGLLGYFKYAGWLVETVASATGADYAPLNIVLPLAISFFTFQQIAYLVDAHKGERIDHSLSTYCLFVLFFPQLIAGPIVHYKEMMPQFARHMSRGITSANLSVGLTIFVIGLFKKLVIADTVGLYANHVFGAAEAGQTIGAIDAWMGAMSYTFQLYFDFSGYSDMAIGLARMFGIRLPLNFNSPYKARSHTEFWRRWHMTLSRFLRDYVYIPLGGNRAGEAKRMRNLFATMVLGGIWHGAGWTFVFWGVWHGFFLTVEKLWEMLKTRMGWRWGLPVLLVMPLFWAAVNFQWVLFRAESVQAAGLIWQGMIGVNGLFSETGPIIKDMKLVPILLALHLWVWRLPNAQQLMRRYRPALETYAGQIKPLTNKAFEWRPTVIWAVPTTIVAVLAFGHLSRVQEFLYFQF